MGRCVLGGYFTTEYAEINAEKNRVIWIEKNFLKQQEGF